MTEWKPYADLVAEIQVRTVIQHAWSAVSHALQYKQEAAIPSKLQRRLYRIAGLFELADEEFVGLRNERESIRLQARHDLERGDDSVSLTAATILEFLAAWEGSDKLSETAERIGFEVKDIADTDQDISAIYDTAVLAGISNLGGLRSALEKADMSYLERLKKLSELDESEGWTVSLSFLVLLMLIYNARERISTDFLVAHGFHMTIAQRVLAALDKSKHKAR